MAKEFREIETASNGVSTERIFKFDKHGQKIIISEQVIKIKRPKPNKLNGRTSKKNNYTSSPRTISEYNSRKVLFKNIKTHPKNNKEVFQGTITYIADLHDTKNQNKEIVELIYNNREITETATTKEEKLKLADKAYDDFLSDTNTKKYSKTISKHSVFSLPPNLNLNKSIQAEILKETIIQTIDEMEEFKDHKYLLAIHEDQINSNGGVHCHIVMAQHNGKGHSLHTKSKGELLERNNEFKQKMVYNLYKDHNIKLENHKKSPFTPNLHKELTFLEVTRDKRVLVLDKTGEIRDIKFKGCDEEVKKHNLQMGDRFDYIQTKSDEELISSKTGKAVYYKGKKLYKNKYSFDNIQRYQDLEREFDAQVKEAKELKQLIKQRQDEQSKTNTEIKSEIKYEIKSESKQDTERKQTKEQETKLKEELSDKELELEINKTSDLFKQQFMKQYKAYINNEISEDEYLKNLTELHKKVEKECNYDDESGFYFNDKDLEYIKKEISKIKPNEPENITKSNENKPNTPTRTNTTKQKKKEKDREW